MTDFDLGRRYDAVLCLFSSIGYVRTLDNVERTLRRFREHVAEGGVTVCRMSCSGRRGRLSAVDFHYLIGREEGIEHATETHEPGLFTREGLEARFAAAGFAAVAYDPEGLIGRGLFTARASDRGPARQRPDAR